MKIIQIDGFRGLITAAFMGVCLFAGFVIFPGMVAMHYWNKYLVTLYMFPQLSILQGVLLWGIVAISYFIVSKKGLAVSFKETPELSEKEIDMIMKNAKIHSQINKVNQIIRKADCFEKSNKNVMKSVNSEKDLSNISSPIMDKNKDNQVDSKEDKTLTDIK